MTVPRVAGEVVCHCPWAGRNLTLQSSKAPPAPQRCPYRRIELLDIAVVVAAAEAVDLVISASNSSGLKGKDQFVR